MSAQADTGKEIVRRQISEKKKILLRKLLLFYWPKNSKKSTRLSKEVKPLVFVREEVSPSVKLDMPIGKNIVKMLWKPLWKNHAYWTILILIGKEYTDSMKLEEANKKDC